MKIGIKICISVKKKKMLNQVLEAVEKRVLNNEKGV